MKKLTKFCIFSLFVLYSFFSSGQLQNHIWYFSNTSLGFLFNFNTNALSLTYVHQPVGLDGCSVATDGQTGNLLFYTEGMSVWDSNNQLMPHGTGLSGGSSCAQSGLVCYVPGQSSRYYVFSDNANFPNQGYIYYSIVDMNLSGNGSIANPMGDVDVNNKNVQLSDSSSESMMVIPGKYNFWVLCPLENSNRVRIYNINSTGIQLIYTYVLGTTLSVSTSVRYGPSGSNWKVAIGSMNETDPIILFDFNKTTGIISNEHTMPGTPLGSMNDYIHGIGDFEWSPDGSKLYISKYRNGGATSYSSGYGGLYQYDFNLPNNHPQLIFNPIPSTRRGLGLKLGPDGKIYYLYDSVYYSKQCIGFVNSPNLAGSSCHFHPGGVNIGTINLGNAQSLPAFLVPIDSSFAPISVYTTPSSACLGDSVTLSFTGGFLGYDARWCWYSGSCGGTLIGTGISVNQTPTVNSSYWVRAEGPFNTTSCASVTIIVSLLSLPPSSVSASPSTLCQGSSTTLTSTGGSLGTGANWNWYSGSCGGTYIISGNAAVLSPSISTIYYVRAEGLCNTTTCNNISVIINSSSLPATAGFSNPSSICNGSASTLNIAGGSLGTGANWDWYTHACGGIYMFSGVAPVVSPAITTTYYVRAEGVCNSTICISVSIVINSSSSAATSASANPSAVCPGSTTTLGKSGGNLGSGAIWKWYSTSCGGTYVSSGSSPVLSPGATTTYYLRAEGTCDSTSCASTTVVVNINSQPAGSVSLTSSSICPGNQITLILSGGSLGTGALWKWYSGSCGGIPVATGIFTSQYPSITTSYYTRAEGICNTTSCMSAIVVVDTNSLPPAGIIATPAFLCTGGSITLNITGGSLGSAAVWNWYSGYCGGLYITSGSSPSVSVVNSATYFVRAAGLCNTTVCISITVLISQNSNQASSVSAAYQYICSGSADTLFASGGTLSPGSDWYWYSVSCGGTLTGTGSSIIINPTSNNEYFARIEGSCNTTSCLSLSIYTGQVPVQSFWATSDRNNYCSNAGGNISLSISGGSGTFLEWYKTTCSGTIVGTGNPKVVTAPTFTTSFYATWETPGCNNSACVSITVSVISVPTPPVTLHPSPGNICSNYSGNIALGASGGTGTTFAWYTGSCGGTALGTGRNLSITAPSSTTVYWGRLQSVSCGNSTCKSVAIVVSNIIPSQPDTISGSINPVAGNIDVYSVTNSPGITYFWNAPTGWTGTSSSSSITYLVGGGSGNISVIASNGCGTSAARTLDVVLKFSISGHFTYDDTNNIPMDSVRIFLMFNGNKIDSTQAGINGYYQFNNILNGSYNIIATTHKPWAGVNATDALKVKLHFSGSQLLTSSICLHAADVNMSFTINTTDAVQITRRFVGSDTSFIRGNWVFEKPSGGDTVNVSVYMNDTVIVYDSNVIQDFKALCVGDVNGSNVPSTGAKSSSKIYVDHSGIKKLHPGESFELPVSAKSNIEAGAISLVLRFPENMIVIDNVRLLMTGNDPLLNSEQDNLFYKILKDKIKIGWFETENPLLLKAEQPFLIIEGRAVNNLEPGLIKLSLTDETLNEIADGHGNPVESIALNINSFEAANSIMGIESVNDAVKIFPNPAKNILYIENAKNSSISIYNLPGELLLTKHSSSDIYPVNLSLLNEGTYLLKVVTDAGPIIRKISILR